MAEQRLAGRGPAEARCVVITGGCAWGQHDGGQWNRALTDSPLWIRRIASARAGAIDSTRSFGVHLSFEIGTVLVQTISRTSSWASNRASAPSENNPCVQATRIAPTWRSRNRSSNSI